MSADRWLPLAETGHYFFLPRQSPPRLAPVNHNERIFQTRQLYRTQMVVCRFMCHIVWRSLKKPNYSEFWGFLVSTCGWFISAYLRFCATTKPLSCSDGTKVILTVYSGLSPLYLNSMTCWTLTGRITNAHPVYTSHLLYTHWLHVVPSYVCLLLF